VSTTGLTSPGKSSPTSATGRGAASRRGHLHGRDDIRPDHNAFDGARHSDPMVRRARSALGLGPHPVLRRLGQGDPPRALDGTGAETRRPALLAIDRNRFSEATIDMLTPVALAKPRDYPRTYRFDARLNEEQNLMIDFVLRSAESGAERAIERRSVLILTARARRRSTTASASGDRQAGQDARRKVAVHLVWLREQCDRRLLYPVGQVGHSTPTRGQILAGSC
jgi:hypothetical protein